MAACGHDPAAAVAALAPRLQMVHLKDVAAPGAEHNVLLGQGVARIPEVMRRLRRLRFPGLVALEYEKDGPLGSDVDLQIAYARRML